MAAPIASPHAHGRSEVWDRPAITRAIAKERRLLGERLRELRVERELSQEQAAERAGVHAKHLQRVEQGLANVTLATMVALAYAYRLPLAALFERTDIADSRARRRLR